MLHQRRIAALVSGIEGLNFKAISLNVGFASKHCDRRLYSLLFLAC